MYWEEVLQEQGVVLGCGTPAKFVGFNDILCVLSSLIIIIYYLVSFLFHNFHEFQISFEQREHLEATREGIRKLS